MLPPKKRPLHQIRDQLRLKNYAYPAEKSYLYWIKLYILFLKAKRSSPDTYTIGGDQIEMKLPALNLK